MGMSSRMSKGGRKDDISFSSATIGAVLIGYYIVAKIVMWLVRMDSSTYVPPDYLLCDKGVLEVCFECGYGKDKEECKFEETLDDAD